MPSYIAFFSIFFFFFSFISSSAGRRILHQPFFPVDSSPAPTTQPPLLPPSQPKYPFSSLSPPSKQNPFFPFSYLSPPPPPPAGSLATFPANISSLVLPDTSHSKPISRKLVAVAVSLSLLSAALITAVAAFLLHHNSRRSFSHHKVSRTDSLRLVPPDAAPSDGGHKPPRNVSGAGSEFLYLGTLRGISEEERESHKATNSSSPGASSMLSYERLGSPELHPLPPLPRQNLRRGSPADDDVEDDNDEFFSPRGSPPPPKENFVPLGPNSRSASYPSSNSGSPANSTSSSLDLSPRSLRSKSPDSAVSFPAPSRLPPPVPARVAAKLPPPPPPPPPRFWEIPFGPPVLVTPSRPAASQNPEPGSDSGSEKGKKMETLVKTKEAPKPKLKPLHWDKVRASSDRAMVWDQLKSSSFQLNEEMIETLFTVNSSSSTVKESAWQRVPPMANQENRVLDPKKSQNIAILLRALNVTIDEVCEALLEGSADNLGTELLESLLKMAPTKEEERKLKEFRDESPFKLGPAEKFLKAVLDIPFAFQRVDAMLYVANFDSEVDYLKRSFETLEAASEELRKSKMFLKLLEAVLKAGNRMNVGTNRGDAHAFKLDTLLKLVDVKGTDGKTTLLHFVVQEISRAEGSRLAGANQSPTTDINHQSSLQDEIEFRKLGLQVVSGLSGELTNVKKAAAMDADVLSNEVTKLAKGIDKIREVSKLNGEAAAVETISTTQKFSESMNEFLKKAEAEIGKIEEGERVAISLVTEITKYFHGDSAKEEAHRFRIFTVVRDFLSILDQVCKEVGKINERRTVSPIRQFPLPVNPNQPPVFPGLVSQPHFGSSDDENSSSSS